MSWEKYKKDLQNTSHKREVKLKERIKELEKYDISKEELKKILISEDAKAQRSSGSYVGEANYCDIVKAIKKKIDKDNNADNISKPS